MCVCVCVCIYVCVYVCVCVCVSVMTHVWLLGCSYVDFVILIIVINNLTISTSSSYFNLFHRSR